MEHDAGRLGGEVAIVTGATSGLGKVIAALFAAEGAAVAVVGRDLGRGTAAAEAAGMRARFVAADLASDAGCRALVDEVVDTLGPPTVLVNNAVDNVAMASDGPVGAVSWETWLSVLSVNLMGAAALCRYSIPHMLAAGHGSIVNVSSRAASRGTPNLAAYSASKGGLNALTRSIAMDYSRQGVRCNTVQAGYILHEVRDAGASEAAIDARRAQHLTRLAEPLDLAQAVLFFAGPESATITGVTLPVDGGSSQVRGKVLG
jgi:NAD(P)-dependent dehydrogenase (short-subunit alcohol dehydrogenase family)